MNKNLTTTPIFTVIMASYNVSSFIDEAINSVINQSIDEWELIIVDDASSDNTYEIACSYSLLNQKIKVFKLSKNMGPAYVRNFAATKARGVWLAMLDADDIFTENKLKSHMEFLEGKNIDNLALIGTGVVQFDENSILNKRIYPTKSNKLKNDLIRKGRFPPHSSIVYKRSLFENLNGFNENYLRAEDFDLWLRMCEKYECASIPKPLVKYRINPSGASSNKTKKGFSIDDYALAARLCLMIRRTKKKDPSINLKEFNFLLKVAAEFYETSTFRCSKEFLITLKKYLKEENWYSTFMFIVSNLKGLLLLIFERIGLIDINKKLLKNYEKKILIN